MRAILTWPRTVRQCTGGYCGPWYVEEIPESYSVTAIVPTWIGYAWRARVMLSYDSTVCTTSCRSVVRKLMTTADPVWTY
jgi:hypothetical protein